jgi:hypothetical protein
MELPKITLASAFVLAVNARDHFALCSLFSEGCVVDACGMKLTGLHSVEGWAREELIAEKGIQFVIEQELVLDDLVTIRAIAVDHGLLIRCVIAIAQAGGCIQTLAIDEYKG